MDGDLRVSLIDYYLSQVVTSVYYGNGLWARKPTSSWGLLLTPLVQGCWVWLIVAFSDQNVWLRYLVTVEWVMISGWWFFSGTIRLSHKQITYLSSQNKKASMLFSTWFLFLCLGTQQSIWMMRLPPSKLNPCCNNNYLEFAPAVDKQYSAMTEMHRFFFFFSDCNYYLVHSCFLFSLFLFTLFF